MHESGAYDIKDAARYLSIAPSTLRYWESQGLVHASRNETNDYRQYALHDLIEASEIAFYRKLGVPVKELKSYQAFSTQELEEALTRTENDIGRRIAELEATRTRLKRQQAFNAEADRLQRAGMQPGRPAIKSLSAIDYHEAGPWKILVEKPWRYGVLIDAASPDVIRESIVDDHTHADALWRRSASDTADTCRVCLLKVAPSLGESNAAFLFAEATRLGISPQLIVGNYLLTASVGDKRWDFHRAWVMGKQASTSTT